MMQPVGGMDQVAKAFERKVSHLIQYNAKVSQIRKTGQGVRIVYTDKASGSEKALSASYAICTFPLSVLTAIDADFSPQHQEAIAVGAKSYAKAIKIGFQANRRFWEEDHNIYGGISWTERDITQIWYPSTDFHAVHGIILGAYIWDNKISERLGGMMPAQRLKKAINDGETIHPGYRREVSPTGGVSIAWEKIPYSKGSWIEWEQKDREIAYRVLNQPDGPIYLAGEHMSYVTGWQEGAILSAHEVIRNLQQIVLKS